MIFMILTFSHNWKGIRKIAPQKISPYVNTPLWTSPLWKLTLWKLPSRNLPPRKLSPGKITPNEIPSPLINHTNESKNKMFCLEESCPIQHPYQNNQSPLWYTHDLTENTGLILSLQNEKKSKNRAKAKIAKISSNNSKFLLQEGIKELVKVHNFPSCL